MSTAILTEPAEAEIPRLKGELYEVIDGERVELPPMAILSIWFASLLHEHLAAYARAKKLGRVLSEALFHLPAPVLRDRRPDVAFVSYERWGQKVPRERNAWDVVPNLNVEVVSPTDGAEELETKINEYQRVGVDLVWVIYPLTGKVYVHESPTQVRILTPTDVLDGGKVLPGFRLQLAELFAEVEAD